MIKKPAVKKSKQEMIENLSKSANGLGGGKVYREGDHIRFVKDNYDGYIRDKDGNPYKISELDKTDNADKAYKLRKKAEKYGTETPAERQERIQKTLLDKKSRNDEKRKAAEQIDLWHVRNTHFKTDEDHDKWERAMDTDKYEMNFMEATQNDWFNEEDSEGARKARLAEYAEYLTDRKKYMQEH